MEEYHRNTRFTIRVLLCPVLHTRYKVPLRDAGNVQTRGRCKTKRESQLRYVAVLGGNVSHAWVSLLLEGKSNHSSHQELSTTLSVVTTTLLHARGTMG